MQPTPRLLFLCLWLLASSLSASPQPKLTSGKTDTAVSEPTTQIETLTGYVYARYDTQSPKAKCAGQAEYYYVFVTDNKQEHVIDPDGYTKFGLMDYEGYKVHIIVKGYFYNPIKQNEKGTKTYIKKLGSKSKPVKQCLFFHIQEIRTVD